jgi:Fe-S cluster assembly ATP-binding protein
MFCIKHLSVSIDEQNILKNFSLDMASGSIHAVMGPNGSGKSTLAQTIVGNPAYEVKSGSIAYGGQSVLELSPHQRANLGIFLSFQQPPAIPGLRVFNLLKEMRQAVTKDTIDFVDFEKEIHVYLDLLKMDYSFLERSCNDGFSGGEKKRFELLQLLVARPQIVILDEIDSGLDIDAIKLVAHVIQKLRRDNPEIILLIITHYKRILDYISPHRVHVLVDGTIRESSDVSLVQLLEQKGYAKRI